LDFGDEAFVVRVEKAQAPQQVQHAFDLIAGSNGDIDE
jgi:hypothetical protein